jgi:hypothetical protein
VQVTLMEPAERIALPATVAAQRRDLAMMTVGLLSATLLLAACGASHRTTGVFAVKNGMTKQQVQKAAGTPFRAGPNCWLYHASKAGTNIVGMRFCFTNGRISLVQTSIHF